MLCERCKIREANIQYTEVINGVKTEHHFCAQCAKELDFGAYSAIFDGDFPLAKLLSGLLGAEAPSERQEKRQKIVCPTCGMSYEEFVKNSCFGCADCYGVFDLLIHENIKQLQGSECHRGKRPAHPSGGAPENVSEEEAGERKNLKKELRNLEIQLHDAIRMEEYETAAQCRDKIRELKKVMESAGPEEETAETRRKREQPQEKSIEGNGTNA